MDTSNTASSAAAASPADQANISSSRTLTSSSACRSRRAQPATGQSATQATALTGGAMSIDEFLRWSSISRTKLYSEVRAGRIRLRKLGTKSLICRDDADAWLHSLPSAS